MSTRSGETKMPTSTSSSKIPIPKSSLSSSKLDQDFIINSPPTSKIPVLKNVKSPVHENKLSVNNQENINTTNEIPVFRSGIPDIRSKVSPPRSDIHEVDGASKSDNASRSTRSISPPKRISTTTNSSKIQSPSKLPLSSSATRLPTLGGTNLSSSSKQIRSSSETLDDIDWVSNERLNGSSSSSSINASPNKRSKSREESVRTSPDGESYISPSKSRRGTSPSKIPIAGSYIRSSSENLLLLTSNRPQQQQSFDDEDEDLYSGSGEGMAESVLGKEFLQMHKDDDQRNPEFNSSKKSRIPAPSTSRNIPEPNWSISKEESPRKKEESETVHKEEYFGDSEYSHKRKKTYTKSSHSTSKLPDPFPDHPRQPARVSTSQLPSYQTSSSSDSDNSSRDSQYSRKKSFEAFVMTGDRMINLAKTPGNIDFQSKYYRRAESTPHDGSFEATNSSATSAPASPTEESSHKESSTNQRQNRRSHVRTSKSEDQLLTASELVNSSSEEKLLINSSCHTLLDTESCQTTAAAPQVSSESSSSRSVIGNDVRLPPRQSSDDTTISPDISTSSLISCSEHYNGDSLLDPGHISPQSPSSPETPEWSLIANGDSFHKDVSNTNRVKNTGEASDSGIKPNGSLITSKDNRVIITINTKKKKGEENSRLFNGETSPTSSGGTLTPELLSPPSLSSEEESDMDSLHSYHPPVKIVDIPSATRLAKRLYNLEGFKKSDISRHLSKNNDFSKAVAEEYCKLFSFTQQSLDEALRKFLKQFCLTGETQDRERVLLHFSKRYLECNPYLQGDTFQSPDSVHTLTCAIMLLNTDLHNEALQHNQRRMTVDEFVENLAELNDGTNFPDELLRQVYAAIKAEPIEWVQDDLSEESEHGPESPGLPHAQIQQQQQPQVEGSDISFTNQIGGINPFLSMPDPDSSVDYKRGYVMRKSCFDSNKKRTKLGKRSWKMYYLSLRDLVLYCFKDEKSAQLTSSYESPMSAMRVHHSLATIAGDYTKKQFVFRLRTCDRAEYLFQTSDQKELETWVETINTVVSRYSCAPLPAPCSNTAKFQRPLYPSSRSKQSLSEQLTNHRQHVRDLSQQRTAHNAQTPERSAKAGVWSNFREKSEFIDEELERFSVYISVLENILSKQQNNQIISSPLKSIIS